MPRPDDRRRYWEPRLRVIRAVEKMKDAQYSALLDRKRLMELRGASDEELKELHLEIDKLVGTLMEPRAESR